MTIRYRKEDSTTLPNRKKQSVTNFKSAQSSWRLALFKPLSYEFVIFVLVHGVFVLVQGIFVWVHEVFVLVQGASRVRTLSVEAAPTHILEISKVRDRWIFIEKNIKTVSK